MLRYIPNSVAVRSPTKETESRGDHGVVGGPAILLEQDPSVQRSKQSEEEIRPHDSVPFERAPVALSAVDGVFLQSVVERALPSDVSCERRITEWRA